MVATRASSKPHNGINGHALHQSRLPDLPVSPEDDAPPLVSKRSFWWYAVLIFPVGFIYSVVFVFSFVSIQHVWRFRQLTRLPSQPAAYSWLLWAGHAEVVFQCFYQYLAYKAQARNYYPPKSKEFLHNLLMQCLGAGIDMEYEGERRPKEVTEPNWDAADRESVHALRQKLRAWFRHPPVSEIKADNVREWLAWAIANGQYLEEAQRDPESFALVEEGLRMTQRRLRHTFPEGYNPNLKPMRLTLDKVQIWTRPLGFYVVCCGLGLACYVWLIVFHGFRLQSRHGLQLLVKPPSEGKSRFSVPVVFLHGLGIGLAQNVSFLRRLCRSTEGVVLLLQPGISTHIWHPRFLDPPPKEAYVAAVKEACDSIGVSKAAIVSQSNGTMVHAWLLRGCRDLCDRNILVDAVSFKLWEADVCWAFLHKPRTSALKLLLSYIILRELGIAHSISRDFQWTDMLLFEHELPSADPQHCRIVLGENDVLVDSHSIVRYLRHCGMPKESIRLLKGGQHGESLIKNGEGLRAVLEML